MQVIFNPKTVLYKRIRSNLSPVPLRSDPGTYALLLRAAHPQSITVGALGTVSLVPGAYVYVGSARGPGGVRARVLRHARASSTRHWLRHARASSTRHWHVDYVRAATDLETVWCTYHPDRLECDWAQALRQHPGASVPVNGFGASDCGCTAHLLRFEAPSDAAAIAQRLRTATPEASPVHVIDRGALRSEPS